MLLRVQPRIWNSNPTAQVNIEWSCKSTRQGASLSCAKLTLPLLHLFTLTFVAVFRMAAGSPSKGVFEAFSQRIEQLMREINHSRLCEDKGRKLSVLYEVLIIRSNTTYRSSTIVSYYTLQHASAVHICHHQGDVGYATRERGLSLQC
jgi:hypothetical protein